ncbi:MAG: carboxypeptidase regulatory-like domain-containing protein, partial [Acidobacteria bacterium]
MIMKRGKPMAMTRVIALVFFFTIPSLALAQKGILEVTCVDEANQPIAGVQVFVQKLGTNEVKSRKSNRDGIAAFKGLSEGYYRVLGRKKGFEPALYEYVELKGGARASVTLTCKPGD